MTTTPADTGPTTDPADDLALGLLGLREVARAAVLDQHLHPTGAIEPGDKGLSRFDLGAREGRIVALTESLSALHPEFHALDAPAVRIVLLGEALTAHAAG